MAFQAILEVLRGATDASRTTLRLDMPDKSLHVDMVASEALASGVRPIKDDNSIDQRNLPTVKFLENERRTLVQDDCLNAEPTPPPALINLYGVKAQMLGPLVRNDRLIGWISVHYTLGPREWSDKDIDALQNAIQRTQRELISWERERRVPGGCH